MLISKKNLSQKDLQPTKPCTQCLSHLFKFFFYEESLFFRNKFQIYYYIHLVFFLSLFSEKKGL